MEKLRENKDLIVNETISIVAAEKLVKTVTFSSPFHRVERETPYALG